MLLEKIKTPGLSHLSYLVGSGGQAAVIDPRRDCAIYVEKARAAGLEITHIFETHRNEDLVSGAPILAEITGATVLHGPNPERPIAYAQTAHDGDYFTVGQLEIHVLETPGHTDDHLAYALFDKAYPEKAVGVLLVMLCLLVMSVVLTSTLIAVKKFQACFMTHYKLF